MPIIFDEAMGQLIRQRLQQDRRTAGAMVDARCTDGSVCLVGCVDSQEQKDAALFVVEGLTGVKEILDQIVVRESPLRTL